MLNFTRSSEPPETAEIGPPKHALEASSHQRTRPPDPRRGTSGHSASGPGARQGGACGRLPEATEDRGECEKEL